MRTYAENLRMGLLIDLQKLRRKYHIMINNKLKISGGVFYNKKYIMPMIYL